MNDLKFGDIVFVIEILSIILSLRYFPKFKKTYYYFFIAFLVFAVLFETLGMLVKGNNNYWVYNIYTFFEFSSLIGVYYFLNTSTKSKKIIIVLSIIYYIIYFISFKYVVLQKYTVIILPFFVVPFMFLYLQKLLNSSKIMNYKKVLPFWLTVGFLIYYLASVPFFSLQYLFGLYDRLLFTLLSAVVIIMHLIFIVSLIWIRPIQKSSSSYLQ
ncbi:hypothetical protein LPB03_13395 [Polaribacter vadi]|jgi:hypothetical protein|uniref:Uncharacterized protein n=1 Tax=Polaribacter vadi TaxID=1774273 RepID=A0A1B8TRK0_9FLAO|nr:hypothetical protein [Polaribacter vadi]AOW18385.1 hypothetical protein LPB03_13395 [Polaribacter vadi]OBY62281.1 hypothetical protein LPB3_13410 [Polaribacter vadi]